MSLEGIFLGSNWLKSQLCKIYEARLVSDTEYVVSTIWQSYFHDSADSCIVISNSNDKNLHTTSLQFSIWYGLRGINVWKTIGDK